VIQIVINVHLLSVQNVYHVIQEIICIKLIMYVMLIVLQGIISLGMGQVGFVGVVLRIV
jgi:hypothetical protein